MHLFIRRRYDLKLLPWAGAATLLHTGDPTHPQASAVPGLAYVFLPLPLSTGLPVHLNGFFEISENRRELWLGDDMKGAGKIRADWNLALIRDAVCASYIQVVLAAVQRMSTGESVAVWSPTVRCYTPVASAADVLWCSLSALTPHPPRVFLSIPFGSGVLDCQESTWCQHVEMWF